MSGAYWFLNSFGLVRWICLALMSLGILLIFVGQQRSSFRFVRGDSGLDRIVEGQIIFLVQYKAVISRFFFRYLWDNIYYATEHPMLMTP